MEITRLSVEGVGRFTAKASIEGFGSGVNILAAANEAGKSTLFRALRACFFERHTSKAAAIKSLETEGVNLPVTIVVDFTLNGCAYQISKSFLRGQRASLIADGREIAKNREADEALWSLLGIEPMNSRSVDEAAFAMLWVGQRASFDLPPITKGGANILGAAIESEVGTVLGSEQAKALLVETRAELAQYVTEKTGKATAQGPLGQAHRKRDELRKEYETQTERLRVLEDQFVRLEQLRGERARLADPDLIAQHERQLSEAKRAFQAAKEAAERLAALEAEERRCQLQKDAAAANLDQLKERAARIAEHRRRIDTLAVDVKALEKEESGLRAKLSEARSAMKEVDATEEADVQRDRLLQQLSEAASKIRAKSELERKAALLSGIIEKRTKTRAELDACKVTEKHVRSLEDIERELTLIDARLTSSAAKLSVALKKDPNIAILIDGRKAVHGEELAVTAPLTLSVGDIASFTIVPPEGFGEDQEKARNGHLARRKKLFEAAGISSLEEARMNFGRRRTLETELKTVDAELSGFGVEPQSPDDALTKWRAQIAQSEAEIANALARAGADAMPDPASIDEDRRALASRRGELRQSRKTLDASSHEIQQLLEEAVSKKAKLSGELDELRRALAADLALSADDTRATEIAEASQALEAALKAHQQAAGALADMRAKSPAPDETERLINKVTRLEQAIVNQQNRLAELDKTISNLEGQIQSAGGDGLGEKVAALESQLAEAELEIRRHQRRVDVLTLLAETIAGALDESRERFYAPILRHLTPFVNDLFPGAHLELGDRFAVGGLKRAANGTEAFSQLSDGTQEQIAVLVRLAMGALLAEQGKPVPVILDDALVFSDDERIARVFDALIRAGANQQIIVLTCRTRAFAPLGGRTLTIEENPA